MALHIKQNKDMLNVSVTLTIENANFLKDHFRQFLNEAYNIILNMDVITQIEPIGAYKVEQLYLGFMRSNRAIYIIGRENMAIAAITKTTRTS